MGEGSATNLWVNVSLRASFPDPLIESEGMLDRGIQTIKELDCPVGPVLRLDRGTGQ